MLFVELIVSFVFTSVLPHVAAKPMHDSVLEGALKVAAISPLEAPVPAHFIVRPDASVLAAIRPKVDTFTFLHAVLEESVIVAAIAPHFNAFPILLLHCSHLRLRFDGVQVTLDVKAKVLAEHAQLCVSVLLPKAFVNFFSRSRGSKDTQAASLPIDPVSFERATILPHHLAVATLFVDVVDDRIIALLSTVVLILTITSSRNLAIGINWKIAGLAHVSERAEVHRLELKLCVLDAQFCTNTSISLEGEMDTYFRSLGRICLPLQAM